MSARCDMLAHELVLRHVASARDRAAIISGDMTVTYGELGYRVAAIAEGLRRRGVGKGDRVVLLVPMSPELYLLVLAIVALGATAVFVEPASTLAEIARVVRLTRPAAFIAIPKAHALRLAFRDVAKVPLAVAVAPPLIARALGAVALETLEAAGDGAALPRADIAADDPAILTFSSGSTGEPKGAPRTHAFLAAQHAAVERLLDRRPGVRDVDMSAFAIVVLSTLCSGMTAVLPPLGSGVDDVDGDELLRLIERHGVTTLSGSPAFLAPIFEAARGRHLFSVRRVASGGAPVPVAMCEAADEKLLPRGSFLVVYGSTEAEPIATIDAREVRDGTADRTRAGDGLCVGLPDEGVRVRLLAPAAGRALAVGPEGIDGLCVDGPRRIGEVAVSGPHVNERYYRNPTAERATKLTDETGAVWHRTGDAAYFDERGRLWIVGRIADVVRRGNDSYHPAAAEAAALAVPGVERAALIADGAGGARLVVQSRARRRDAAALIAHLADAGITVDDIAFTRSLPVDRRHRAKLDYRAIRGEYAS